MQTYSDLIQRLDRPCKCGHTLFQHDTELECELCQCDEFDPKESKQTQQQQTDKKPLTNQ